MPAAYAIAVTAFIPFKQDVGWVVKVFLYIPEYDENGFAQDPILLANEIVGSNANRLKRARQQMQNLIQEIAYDKNLLKNINDRSQDSIDRLINAKSIYEMQK